MTLTIVLFSTAMLLIYLFLRWPFFKLPLHMDTGFYVSNQTICDRKFRFSKGWNARYAGCSKVVPEFFYSVVYLLHGEGDRYKFYSRFYYSFYCFAVAVLVGLLAYQLSVGSALPYVIGLVIFCLLSSEPHYGIYFENGEQFELLPQVAGILLIQIGLARETPWMVGGGVGLWMLDAYFIKLSSLPAAFIVGLGTAYILPTSIPYSLAFSFLTTAIYLWWIVYNGQQITRVMQPIVGHEVYFGHRISLKAYLTRLLHKAGLLVFICLSHPVIPAVALLGLLSWRYDMSLLLVYLAAVSASFLIQAARIWYYTIPFLPVIALLATFGVEILLRQGGFGLIACFGLLVLWLFMHGRRVYGTNLDELNRWAWLPHRSMPGKNLALDQAFPELSSLIQKNSFLVFGVYNQAYALIGTSYPTAIISPSVWLDSMDPNWERKLNEDMAALPPRYILDSDACFDPLAAKEKTGVSYALKREFAGDFRLFELDR
jgi:hypothetical protein